MPITIKLTTESDDSGARKLSQMFDSVVTATKSVTSAVEAMAQRIESAIDRASAKVDALAGKLRVLNTSAGGAAAVGGAPGGVVAAVAGAVMMPGVPVPTSGGIFNLANNRAPSPAEQLAARLTNNRNILNSLIDSTGMSATGNRRMTIGADGRPSTQTQYDSGRGFFSGNRTTGWANDDGSGRFVTDHISLVDRLKDSWDGARKNVMAFAAAIYTLGRVKDFIMGIGEGFADVYKKILAATEEYRQFELSISGVAGGTGRSKQIDQALIRESRNTPLTIKELHDAGVGLTFTQYGAAKVATGTPEGAAKEIAGYGTLLSQLQFLAREQGIGGASIAVREALAGNFQSARRRLNVAPELIAGSIGKTLPEITGNQELTIKAFKGFADTWIGQEPIQGRMGLISNVTAKIADSWTQMLAKIGESGMYDKITDRFRSMLDRFNMFIDQADKDGSFKRFGDQAVAIFDILSDTITSFFEKITGQNDAVGALKTLTGSLGDFFDYIVRIGKYIPQLASWMGDAIKPIMKEVAFALENPKKYLAGARPEQDDPYYGAKQQAEYDTRQQFRSLFGNANDPSPAETASGIFRKDTGLGGDLLTVDPRYSGSDAERYNQMTLARKYYFDRVGDLSKQAPFNRSMPAMPDYVRSGVGESAYAASPYQRTREFKDRLQDAIQSGNIRPLLSAISTSISGASDLFQGGGAGQGTGFAFYPTSFARATQNALSLPGQVRSNLTSQGKQKTYADMMSDVMGNIARVSSMSPSRMNESGLPTPGGLHDFIGQGTAADAQLKDLMGRKNALARMPAISGAQLGNVAGSLLQQSEELDPSVRGMIRKMIMTDALGLVDAYGKALTLDESQIKEVRDAYAKNLKENAAFFLTKIIAGEQGATSDYLQRGRIVNGQYQRAPGEREGLAYESAQFESQRTRLRGGMSDELSAILTRMSLSSLFGGQSGAAMFSHLENYGKLASQLVGAERGIDVNRDKRFNLDHPLQDYDAFAQYGRYQSGRYQAAPNRLAALTGSRAALQEEQSRLLLQSQLKFTQGDSESGKRFAEAAAQVTARLHELDTGLAQTAIILERFDHFARFGKYADDSNKYQEAPSTREARKGRLEVDNRQLTDLLQRRSGMIARGETGTADFEKVSNQAAELTAEMTEIKHASNDALLAIEEFSGRSRDAIQSGIGDALYNIITQTGSVKDAFKSMAQSILHSFTDMVSKMAMQSLVGDLGVPGAGAGGSIGGLSGIIGSLFGGGAGGGGGGNIFGGGSSGNLLGRAEGGYFPGSFIPFHAFSEGGVTSRPTIGMISEYGHPEAVVPLSRGRSIPVEMRGGGGRTYIVAKDEADARRKGYDPSRDDLVHVLDAVASDIGNGGRVSQAIKRKHGR